MIGQSIPGLALPRRTMLDQTVPSGKTTSTSGTRDRIRIRNGHRGHISVPASPGEERRIREPSLDARAGACLWREERRFGMQAAQPTSPASTESKKTKLTYFEAALAVLGQSNKPLTTREILDQIIRQKLVSPSGRTPLATLAATLYRHANIGDRVMHLGESGAWRARRGTVRWSIAPARSGQH